jgi:protein-L-isoaspartate(D-aspartate) O-methyltransferase
VSDPERLRKKLVGHLKASGAIRTRKVEDAMLSVPREIFVPGASLREAYMDRPLSIGSGQTISAPHMVAIMAEELEMEASQKVLEIGGGSGYHAAVVSRILGDDGMVVSIEFISSLSMRARKALERAGISNVDLRTGDGSIGCEEQAPFDRIYYTCAAPFIPECVLAQLKHGGILLSVEGEPYSTQRLIRYRKKDDGSFERSILTYCVFVPLVGKHGQRS